MAFPPVTVCYLPNCPSCLVPGEFLTRNRVPFQAVDVFSPTVTKETRVKTGRVATPLIVFGWDRDRVKSLLHL